MNDKLLSDHPFHFDPEDKQGFPDHHPGDKPEVHHESFIAGDGLGSDAALDNLFQAEEVIGHVPTPECPNIIEAHHSQAAVHDDGSGQAGAGGDVLVKDASPLDLGLWVGTGVYIEENEELEKRKAEEIERQKRETLENLRDRLKDNSRE